MSKEELRAVREEIFSINSFAEVIETVQSRVELKRIMGVSSFSIEKTLEARSQSSGSRAPAALTPPAGVPCGVLEWCCRAVGWFDR